MTDKAVQLLRETLERHRRTDAHRHAAIAAARGPNTRAVYPPVPYREEEQWQNRREPRATYLRFEKKHFDEWGRPPYTGPGSGLAIISEPLSGEGRATRADYEFIKAAANGDRAEFDRLWGTGAVENRQCVLDDALIVAVMEDRTVIIDLCLARGAARLHDAAIAAIRRGDEQTLHKLEKHSDAGHTQALASLAASDYEEIELHQACRGLDYNALMEEAAAGNRLYFVQICQQRGATDFTRAVLAAAKAGGRELLEYLHEQGADTITLLPQLAERGDQQLLRLCHSWGASQWNCNEAAVAAATRGHLECLKDCIAWGATSRAACLMNSPGAVYHWIQANWPQAK